jgi:hypothetical protein
MIHAPPPPPNEKNAKNHAIFRFKIQVQKCTTEKLECIISFRLIANAMKYLQMKNFYASYISMRMK